MRRTLLRMRLPLALFAITILVSFLGSLAIFYSAFTAHINGEYFRLETKYLESDFPRNWHVIPWEEENSSGTRYGVTFSLLPVNLSAGMIISIFDENLSKLFLEKNNLTDASSAVMFSIKSTYESILKENKNATLHFIDNGTLSIFNRDFRFVTVTMEKGYTDRNGNLHNITYTFMSHIQGKIMQILLSGLDNDYFLAKDTLLGILDSTKMRDE